MKILCVGGDYYPEILSALTDSASKIIKNESKKLKLTPM